MIDSAPLVLSLREQIADRLRSDVLTGRLAVGERLSELGLVERFGVSRAPIREALQQLTHEGLLEARPNAGVKVAPHASDALCDLIVGIRKLIESFAVRAVFGRLSPKNLEHFQKILARMRTACVAGDYAAIAEHDIEFHRYLVRLAGERDLEAIWLSLVGRIRTHFRETQFSGYAKTLDIHEEHVAILEALQGSELEAALELLHEKIT